MEKEQIEEARSKCPSWDDELGCEDDYPEDCPIAVECREDAEEEEEEITNAAIEPEEE